MIRAGIDIGAHSLRLVLHEEGLVFDEPALAAFNKKGDILAIGQKALELKGQSSEEIRVLSPIEDGNVDFDVLEALLNELCYEFGLFRMFQKTVLMVCYPTILSEDVIDRLKDSLLALGADEIYFDQEIWIAAVGSGLDLYLPVSSTVMNIGSSNCDIASFRDGQIRSRLSSRTLNGQRAAADIQQWLLEQKNLLISPYSLDQIVRSIGCVKIQEKPVGLKIKGVDASSRSLREIVLNENDIARILAPFARELGEWLNGYLSSLSEADQIDIRERGIIASGGAMKIHALAEVISTMADCPVYITDEPDKTVAQGLYTLISNLKP